MQTATALSVKIQRMTHAQQRKVMDFAELLISREKNPIEVSIREERLLNVSVWSDGDIDAINRATVEVNKLNLPNY
jgi:hypothetical protein